MKGCSLGISEAATLALHAAIFLANTPAEPATSREMAAALAVSEAHLSKVLNRLAKAGLLHSTRGPSGGFSLARAREEITLLEVYEATEGPFQSPSCLWATPHCDRIGCLLGELMHSVNAQILDFLSKTTLADPGLAF
jgi:Rrf2 family protein